MNGLLDFKSISTGCIKDVDMSKRVVTGYLSAFGNKDHDGDIVEKGAFKKTIGERKDQIYFLNQHKWSEPHGKFSVLKEDNFGLYFESDPFIDTTYSSDALKLYDAGIIKEHSFGFITIKDGRDHDQDARLLKEIKLFEGSNVTLGANPQTPFTGMKGVKDLNDRCQLLYKAIRNGDFTDDTFVMLEFALKELQFQAFELGKKALTEPLDINTQKQSQIINDYIKSI